jgi:hypothetical protein
VDLLARGTDGALFHAPTDHNGTPLYWERVGGIIKGQPCGVWDPSGTHLDVYAIDLYDHPNRITYTPGGSSPWSQWTVEWGFPGATGVAGHSETEGIGCARRPDSEVDLFMAGPAFDAVHEWANAAGDVVGTESLTGIIKGAPSGAWDAQGSRLDLFVIDIFDHPNRKTWSQGWGSWVPQQGASGAAESETVTVSRRPVDGTLDLFVRGTPGDEYHGWTDSNGNIFSWEVLASGTPMKGAAGGTWNSTQSRLDAFAIGGSDGVFQISWSGSWSLNWRALPGAGIAA